MSDQVNSFLLNLIDLTEQDYRDKFNEMAHAAGPMTTKDREFLMFKAGAQVGAAHCLSLALHGQEMMETFVHRAHELAGTAIKTVDDNTNPDTMVALAQLRAFFVEGSNRAWANLQETVVAHLVGLTGLGQRTLTGEAASVDDITRDLKVYYETGAYHPFMLWYEQRVRMLPVRVFGLPVLTEYYKRVPKRDISAQEVSDYLEWAQANYRATLAKLSELQTRYPFPSAACTVELVKYFDEQREEVRRGKPS